MEFFNRIAEQESFGLLSASFRFWPPAAGGTLNPLKFGKMAAIWKRRPAGPDPQRCVSQALLEPMVRALVGANKVLRWAPFSR